VEIITGPVPAQSPFIPAEAKIVVGAVAQYGMIRGSRHGRAIAPTAAWSSVSTSGGGA
jgi:hypothetical protein